ncbi:MAG: DUF1566 domain-containing protein [Calditrichaeota bacterium]|nr:DUF1566 domain-containing protein [Calditrichota bacterium]
MKSYFQIPALFLFFPLLFSPLFAQSNSTENNSRFELDSVKQVVYDHGKKLVWQQSGSTDLLMGDFVQSYVDSLNSIAFGGYTDWRLPTKSEAQSLITSEVKRGDELKIDPVFDTEQAWIYTNETDQAEWPTIIYFTSGKISTEPIGYFGSFVRLVRNNTNTNIAELAHSDK